MNDKQTIEAMMLDRLRKGGSDRIQTLLTHAELRNAGCQFHDGKFTGQVRSGDGWKTFFLVPKEGK